ncbi:MAG: DUF4823 domain-containing protein [Bacteroidales bacterium]|jgi:hypothetical protein|nr:DUF4823 domain-containing protein [Bacteroidales bacterium]
MRTEYIVSRTVRIGYDIGEIVKKTLKILFSIGITFLMLSCTITNIIKPNENFSAEINLDKNAGIFIAMPKNGMYGNTVYQNSGSVTQSTLQYVLEDYIKVIYLGANYEQIEDAKNTAKSRNVKYLYYPTITHWEDRATAWSGIPDALAIKMIIYDIELDQTVYSAELFARGTSITLSTGDPSDLLLDIFKQFANKIYK